MDWFGGGRSSGLSGVLGPMTDIAAEMRPVAPGDEGGLRLASAPVEHEAAGGGLLHPPRARLPGGGHMGMIGQPRGQLRSAGVAPDPSEAQERALTALTPVAGLLTAIGTRFATAGHELALVGGPVRDALL